MKLSATKLNSIYNELSSNCANPSLKVDFWSGESISVLSLVAKKILPFSKVAVLYSKASYTECGLLLSEKLKQNGNSVIHVVLPDNFTNSVESYSDIFNLPEDVRLIIAIDSKFFSLAKYFASLRQIDCALAVNNLNCFGVLSPSLTLRNGNSLDEVKISANLHIIFDYKKIEQSKDCYKDAYAFLVSHALALVDLRFNALILGEKINSSAYSLASKSIVTAYSLFTNKREDFYNILTESLFSLELANLFADNKLYQSFSSKFVADNLKMSSYAENLLTASCLIAKLYGLYFSDKYNKILTYPDYVTRAEFIANTLSVTHAYALEKLLSNCNIINQLSYSQLSSVKKLSKDVISFIECSSNMKSTFTALGGNTESQLQSFSALIKHSGDLELNGMTLLRESGITELI